MTGSVTLVGAGPGPGLITVRGLRALRSAEVLIYDDLIDRSLLAEVPPECELLYAGKRYGNHSQTQAAINALLIERAGAGRAVVRLKGGDALVFGRGGEEALALRAANIPYEIVPGVSSAIAVPEALGIPVTHRGAARSFTVVTGHSADGGGEDFSALAKLRGTLVFLMGLHSAESICARLISGGKDPDTPAAILSRGFSAEQRRVDGTLADIAEKASRAEAPAILVVGPTAGLDVSGTLRRGLEGVTVTVTGTASFTGRLSSALTARGCSVRRLPLLRLVPDYAAIPEDFSRYSWLVFTSGNAASVFFDCLRARRTDLRALAHLRFACVGSGTAKRLESYGFFADFIPPEYSGAALGRELPFSGGRVLLLRAKDAAAALPEALRRRAIPFDNAAVYTVEPRAMDCAGDADYAVFSSGQGVEAFFAQGGTLGRAKPVCIGAATAARLRQFTDAPPLIPSSHTAEGITDLIWEDVLHETFSTVPAERPDA